MVRLLLLSALLLLPAWALYAQAPVRSPDVRQTYAKLCAGCHGDDARGSQQGPGLAGNLRLRRRSAQSLRNVISRGIPSAGMPGFPLPEAELDAMVALVVSLNASASEAGVEGDRAAGEAFFFGQGKCAGCHMVTGRGTPVGPDLSHIARERTVDQLRDSVLTPARNIASGYELVTVQRRDGRSIRGFARNRTAFGIAV